MAQIDAFWRFMADYGMIVGFIIMGACAIILIWNEWRQSG